MSINIESENDLVVFLGRKLKDSNNKIYPKVDILSRSTIISPDIDLLLIDQNNKKVIGYETKLLKYVEKWKKYTYNSIYAGIGEALLYFQYGVDRVHLCIGVPLYDSIPEENRTRVLEKINCLDDAFNFSMLNKIIGIDIIELYDDKFEYRTLCDVKRGLLKHPIDFERNKKLLLEEEFHYELKCYRKIYDS